MIKTILFVRRKADLTHDEFRHYYETVHAPLAVRTLPWLHRYVRNYFPPSPESDWEYDVATEFWFENEEDWAATMAFARSEEGRILEEDEARFMDRSSMKAFTVVELETDCTANNSE